MINFAQNTLLPGEKKMVKLVKIEYVNTGNMMATDTYSALRLTMKDADGNTLSQDFQPIAPNALTLFIAGIKTYLNKEQRAALNFLGDIVQVNGLTFWKFTTAAKAKNKELLGKEFEILGTRNTKGYLNLATIIKDISEDSESTDSEVSELAEEDSNKLD